MSRPKHWTETVIVDTVPCDWCGAPIERTTQQVRQGKRFCDRVHAAKWVGENAPRTAEQVLAKRKQGQRLGRQRARVVRNEGAKIAVGVLMADLKANEDAFFLRPAQWAEIKQALLRAYSRGYNNAYRAAWQKMKRERVA